MRALKARVRALLMEMHGSAACPLVIFRPGVVIGAGAPPGPSGVVGMFLVRHQGPVLGRRPHRSLPLVLVDDVAAALALGHGCAGHEGSRSS
jgi:nucleoside-diphosphate-sugar epimerase